MFEVITVKIYLYYDGEIVNEKKKRIKVVHKNIRILITTTLCGKLFLRSRA